MFKGACRLKLQNEIFNSGFAAGSYLKSIGFEKKAYLIGEQGLGERQRDSGLTGQVTSLRIWR